MAPMNGGHPRNPEHASARRRGARALSIAALGAGALLAACGGGPSGGGGTPAAKGTVSGTAVKGPVSGATVIAFAVTNGAQGAQLGTATTDAAGRFAMSVGDYSGPMMLRLSAGSYTDEATGATMPMMSGDVMTVALPVFDAGAGMSGVMMTPLTSMAQARAQAMGGGMTAANVAAANAAVGRYCSVNDILQTMPMDPLVPGSGATATQDMKDYGMCIAAMSEYAKSVGMTTSSSSMVTVMMEDASDGVMNGMMGSMPISMSGMAGMGGGMMGGNMQPTMGTSGLADAMTAFMQNTSVNRSGVPMTDIQPLIDKLRASSGAIE